jgi:methyl-accepting chemotaxis protein
MKISTLLTLTLGLICIIVTLEFGFATYRSAQNYQIVGKIGKLVETRGKWYAALTSLSVERSLSQVLLASSNRGVAEIAALRRKQIEMTDSLFAQSREKLQEAGDFPMQVELADDIDQSLGAIAKFRATVDGLLQQELSQRDPAAVTKVIDEIKEKITSMKGMATHMVTPNSVTSAVTILLGDLQDQAFIMREYGGRARSLYAVATLHGRGLTSTELDYVDAMLHRVHEAWQDIEHIVETFDAPDIVDAQVKTVEKAMMTDFMALLASLNTQMLAQAGNANAKVDPQSAGAAQQAASDAKGPITYDVSFAQFFERSTATLKSVSDLSSITGQTLTELWETKAARELWKMVIASGALLVIIGLSAATLWLSSVKITRRMQAGLSELAALTAGALDSTVTRQKGDLREMAQLSDGLENLQGQLRRAAAAQTELAQAEAAQQHIVERLSGGLTKLAAGDLSMRITDRFDAKYQALADDFNAASAALGALVARVIDTSNTILSGARGISRATTELSQRTETQGMTLQNAAAALEELTRNIISSQSDATELDRLASLASDKGAAMGLTMTQTVAAIEAIKSSSQQIEQIVDVIEDIAFQTNLLALNAGVEATRAGAEGSGFAVIASEVRGLAERSAQSAQDIKSLIATSGLEVNKGVEYVAEAEASAGDIGAHIQKISTLISRIALAATEQSQGLTRVNDGVSQLDLVTQTNVAMVEETTAECSSLSAVAQDLSQLVAHFQIDRAAPSDLDRRAQAA